MKLLREYIRTIIEANEYGWEVSSKKNMLLDKEGMEQSDKDNQEKYLKSMGLMEGLLTEAAMGPKDLEAIPGAMITITDWGSSANVQYYDAGKTLARYDVPSGRVAIGEIIDPEMWGNGPCGGAWQVQEANADHGWGPLLYDVAIEFATMRANGLVPDRREVSMEARSVWRYYLSNRSDVKSHQLDNLKNQLTKTEKDNCNQKEAGYKYGEEEYMTSKAKWWKSPLSKRYTKTPTVINRLRKIGRIEIGKV